MRIKFLLSLIVGVFTFGCDFDSKDDNSSTSSSSQEIVDFSQFQDFFESDSGGGFNGFDGSDGSTPSQTGSGGFLWKPTSESTGGLVVLLPGALRGRTEEVCTISGSFGTESANMRHEHHNGGRPHFYFSRPGSAYGSNITVQAPLKDGTVYSKVVPNGASRFE